MRGVATIFYVRVRELLHTVILYYIIIIILYNLSVDAQVGLQNRLWHLSFSKLILDTPCTGQL